MALEMRHNQEFPSAKGGLHFITFVRKVMKTKIQKIL